MPKGKLFFENSSIMKMEKEFKRIVYAAMVILFFALGLAIYNQIQINQLSDKKTEVVGVIRNVDDKGWYAIDDKAHEPINIADVKVKNGDILVDFTFKATKIHTFVVTPDETFARAGFFVGASVKRTYAVITVTKRVQGKVVPIDASSINSKLGNFWRLIAD